MTASQPSRDSAEPPSSVPRRDHHLSLAAETQRILFAQSRDAILVAGSDGRYVDANPAALALLGYERDEMLMLRFEDVVPPGPSWTAERYARFVREGHWEGEVDVRTKTGLLVPTEARTVVLDGAHDGAHITIFRDLSDRNTNEVTRARLAALVSSSPDAIISETLDGIITDWNPAAQRLYGYTAREAIGRHLSMLMPADRAGELEAFLARVRAGESVEGIETVRRTRDGRLIDIALTVFPIYNDARQIIGASSINRDVTERKAAAHALAAAHQRTRQVLESITDGFFALDEDWRITDVNSAAERMFGITRDEARGLTICQEAVPAITAPLYAALTRAMTERHPASAEGYYPPVDGWLEVRAYPSPEGLSVFFRDVTERKHLEDDLRASEAKYRTLVEQIPAVVYVLAADQNQTGVYYSPKLETLLNLRPEDALTRTGHWLDWVHPDDRARVAAEDERATVSDEPFRLEYRYLRGDGSIVWVRDECVPVHDESGRIVAWQGLLLDITERIAAEQALAASETRFRTAFENAPIGMALTSAGQGVLQVNRALCDMLGYTADEIIAKSLRGLTHPDDAAANRVLVARALAGEIDTFELEKRYFRKDGQIVWAHLRVSLVRDDSGTPLYFISQTQDITEHKRSDEELRAALDAAQAAIRARSQFLAMMSHELRTPMQAVLGYADLLLAGPDESLSSEQTEDIQTIRLGAERMIALVNQMLDLSRLDVGRLELSLQPVDVAEIIEQVRQDIAPQAASKGLTLCIELPPRLPLVTGDAVRLRQILLNLVGNAVKFTDQGSVDITAGTTDTGLDVAVSDTGIGIETEALRHIFEEFRQADSGMTRRYAGAGLGLAIARKLAEQHGGRISVSSQPRVGSTFTLHLPLPGRTLTDPDDRRATSQPS